MLCPRNYIHIQLTYNKFNKYVLKETYVFGPQQYVDTENTSKLFKDKMFVFFQHNILFW